MALHHLGAVESPADLRRRIEAMPLPRNFPEMLEEAAARYGDREAWNFFEAEGRWARLTYADLRDAVFQAARALAAIGVGNGSRVVVMAGNRPEFPLLWLAIGCLGAAMVPANIKYTQREVDFLVADAEATHAIIEDAFIEIFRSGQVSRRLLDPACMIVLGAGREGLSGFDRLFESADPTAPLGTDLPPDTLVNIQYTSGTTGFPKGCMLSHEYWFEMGLAMAAQAGVPVQNILVAQHFYYLDPQWLLMMALFQGGTAFIATKPSVRKFLGWVRDYRIHYCILFEPIFKALPAGFVDENELRLVNIFGFTPPHHAELERKIDTRAREAFGMTEIGSGLYVPIDREDMVGSASCGIAAPFRDAKVMAGLEREAEPGEQGELWVKGPGMMKGYWKRPEANAELFRDGWFRTGDLFTRDAEGFFYYKGRNKDMIRRNAENVAAREIETVLREMREIQEAAVVAVPDALKGEEIKAYILLQSGIDRTSIPPQMILHHCEQRLARFKIPRYISYVDSFPMTVSDRVEKKTLIAEAADLRLGSYDADEACWR